MKSTQQQLSQHRPARGFTFLEFTVALVVFGITLAGLFPLLVITSRGLQPIKSNSSFDCRTPSRDWGKNAGDDPNMDPGQGNQRHAWQLTPYDDPWLRKLGAGAQTTSSAVTSTSPPPIQAPVVYLDDYSGMGPGSNDGTGTFTAGTLNTLVSASSAGYQGDYHFAETLLAVPIVTWRIPVVADGWYSVEATWPTTTALALTNATYVVTAPNNTPATLTLSPLNQASPGAGISDSGGVTWWPILPASNRCVHLLTNDTVTVTLAAPQAQGGKFLIADAVRIVRNDVAITSVQRSFGCKNADGTAQPDVTANVSVTVNIPQ